MEFENDNIQSNNPFVDKLLKNLKILVYNAIIKDEYTADKMETSESLSNAETYMACVEDRVSLVMFGQIPDQFLREVGFTESMISSYKNLNYDVDYIPKDNVARGTTYRSRLVSKLRPWFLATYEEKNEYYRKITGLPPLGDWGIPVRDYEQYLPEGFSYNGEFLHEIGADACKELEKHGVLDIVRRDYPNYQYLNYLTAGITPYEARKAMDFNVLWIPDTCDDIITEEFENRYQERRKFLLKAVYNSAMEIESEYYHSTMQIYLLVTTLVDILADTQSHMAKKDILDRRCIEFIFSIYGIPYYKELPYKYQEHICLNIHNLVKYKACTENFNLLTNVFEMDDVVFYKYYLIKERVRNVKGELVWYGDKIKTSIFNDNYIKTSYKTIDLSNIEEDIIIPYPIEDYFKYTNYVICAIDDKLSEDFLPLEQHVLIPYDSIKDHSTLRCIFIYSEVDDITREDKEFEITTSNPYLELEEPFEYCLTNSWPLLVHTKDNTLLRENQYDIIDSTFNTVPLNALQNRIFGDVFTFSFFYIDKYPYVKYYWKEDYDKTTNLVFSKIPAEDIYSTKYIFDASRWKDYDMIIAKDMWWIGKHYRNGSYQIIKNSILNDECNYMRTKYYSIGRVIDFFANTVALSFFFSSLFDDVFLEEDIRFIIPSISFNHSFKISHLFLYMYVLTQIFYGEEDLVMEVLEEDKKIKVTGFNYKGSLPEIRQYIIRHHFDPEAFKIWDLIIPTEQITDMKEFMSIQNNNEQIYHYIRHAMIESQDYREYTIWRYIYEYFMTWEFNQDYFRMSNGDIASTYSSFLQDQDIVLYNSIQHIKNIFDDEEKIDTLAGIIDDICYILEEYLDKNLAKFVFSHFVGRSSAHLLKYLSIMVEFFKSFKIVFNERGEVLNVGSGGSHAINEDTVMIPYDYCDCKNISRQIEYYNIEEVIYTHNINRSKDFFNIREDCVIIHRNYTDGEEIINVD